VQVAEVEFSRQEERCEEGSLTRGSGVGGVGWDEVIEGAVFKIGSSPPMPSKCF